MARFALAILFAVLVAASRPVATGGAHDLLAVGVVLEEQAGGRTLTRTVLASPTREALDVYDALLRSPARGDLVQGGIVHAHRAASPPVLEKGSRAAPEKGPGPLILSLVFYGARSRAGRATVAFDGEAPLEGSAGALKVAETVSRMTPAVTAAAARVLLSSDDDGAVRDALECLAAARSDVATAEAMKIALDGTLPASRRVLAIGIHRTLGGATVAPGEYARLAADTDPLVAAAAK